MATKRGVRRLTGGGSTCLQPACPRGRRSRPRAPRRAGRANRDRRLRPRVACSLRSGARSAPAAPTWHGNTPHRLDRRARAARQADHRPDGARRRSRRANRRPHRAGGYQFPDEFNSTLDHRRWLCRPSAAHRTHHLHLVDERAELDRHLRFRDQLRGGPTLREDYARLKRELSTRFSDDRGAYSEAKSAFIRRALTAERTRQPPS